MQNFRLKFDKWTNRRTNEKNLQTAKWTERLNLYIPEILCMPYVLLKPFQRENYNSKIRTYTMTM